MAVKTTAVIRLKFASEKKLAALLSSLLPEANSPLTRRASINLKEDGSFLLLTVEAEDTTALRSTLNAYLRWINSAVSAIDLLEQT